MGKKKADQPAETAGDKLATAVSPALKAVGRALAVLGRLLWIWIEAWGTIALSASLLLRHPSGVVRLAVGALTLLIVISPAFRVALAKNVTDTVTLWHTRRWRADCVELGLVVQAKRTRYPDVKITVGPLTWRQMALRVADKKNPFRPEWMKYQVKPHPRQYDPKLRSHLEETLKRNGDWKAVSSIPSGAGEWVITVSDQAPPESVVFKMPPPAESVDELEDLYQRSPDD